jgi:hypothetical protein
MSIKAIAPKMSSSFVYEGCYRPRGGLTFAERSAWGLRAPSRRLPVSKAIAPALVPQAQIFPTRGIAGRLPFLVESDAMNPRGWLVALLCVFVVVSTLNYWWYVERTEILVAQARSIARTKPIDYALAQSEDIIAQTRREYHNMITREVILVLVAGAGIVMIWRLRSDRLPGS